MNIIKKFLIVLGIFAVAIPVSAQFNDQNIGETTNITNTTVSVGNYCPNLMTTLRRGSRDSWTNGQVSELQKFLSGYYDVNSQDIITGYFGRVTERYVVRYQREQGLPSYGVVGVMTRNSIARTCGTTSTPVAPVAPVIPRTTETTTSDCAQGALFNSNTGLPCVTPVTTSTSTTPVVSTTTPITTPITENPMPILLSPVVGVFTVTPGAIISGETATLSWAAENVSSCSITLNGNPWLSSLGNIGTVVVAPTATSVYKITCTGSSKPLEVALKEVSLSVTAPVVIVPPVITATTTPTTTTSTTPTTTPVVTPTTAWWQPAPSLSWQWQLSGTLNTGYNVDVYDIDLFDNSVATIQSLKNRGIKVVCYFSAGTYENWRSDAPLFPKSVLGNNVEGWAGEKWLDVSNYNQFTSIMKARLDLAKSKGCDGVEPDNVDGFQNNSGFKLTDAHQLAYNKWLATEAHNRGLAVALKNDLDQVSRLVSLFDFAINEQCFQYNECSTLRPFIAVNKAVFGVEYEIAKTAFCSKAQVEKFSWLKMNYSLNGGRDACPL